MIGWRTRWPIAPTGPAILTSASQRIEHDKALNPGKRYDKDQKTWVRDEMGTRSFYGARARGDRHRVWIIYVAYQGVSYLSIEDAETYLAWLDAGNVGRHFAAILEAS